MPGTVNGLGTHFYGRGNPDVEGNYTCTEWLVVFFVPVIPLRSVRVLAEEEKGHSFGLGITVATSREYTIVPARLCWPQVGRVYGFIAATALWWYLWLGVLLPLLHLERASYNVNVIGGMSLSIAGVAAPFILLWWLRRRTVLNVMLTAMKADELAAGAAQAAAATAAPDPIAIMRERGVRFTPPPGWSCEYLPEHNGVLLLAGESEGGYQANLFLEVKAHGKTTLLAAAQQLSRNLRQQKANYQEVAVQEGRARSLPWASVECTHHRELALTDTHYIVQLHTADWLFISASALSSHEAKYRPVIRDFLDSI